MSVVRADALRLPLADNSVDLVVTSPPYFALRSYQDGDAHYAGQVGSEPTPAAFVDALLAATAELVRVLKPTGSMFVNLGDKYAGSGGNNQSGLGDARLTAATVAATGFRGGPRRYNQNSGGIPAKSLMGLPWRYANRVVDQLGLILRAEIIWAKPNGMPEPVADRVRRSHETWFHFTRQGRYYAAVDELRQPYAGDRRLSRRVKHPGDGKHDQRAAWSEPDLRGSLPGSVWTIPTEPLTVSAAVRAHHRLPDHYAAFPSEWPRRIILGWSPPGICVACGEGRRPVVGRAATADLSRRQGREAIRRLQAAGFTDEHIEAIRSSGISDANYGQANRRQDVGALATEAKAILGAYWREFMHTGSTITGYACACDAPLAPTRPAIVLDPFGGTGTVAMVARALGRVGISLDLSADYCRLARWRIHQSGHAAKAEDRTWAERQGTLL